MRTRLWTYLCAGLAAILFAAVWIVGGQRPAAGAVPYQTVPEVDPFVVDHRWLSYFDELPDEYITAASQLKLFHLHSWLGNGINQGLTCMNNLPPAPGGYCHGSEPMDVKYDRALWEFDTYADGSDLAWYSKTNAFISHLDVMTETYDVVSFEFNYSDFGAPQFFDEVPRDQMPNIVALEEELAQHPEKTHVFWTMALGTALIEPNAYNGHIYNGMLREYTSTNGKILFDVAQILSHREDGTHCIDEETGVVLMCTEYSDGPQGGGSLNVNGRERMAKAMWLLMAHLAGWNPPVAEILTPTVPPGSPPPTATHTATPTATRTTRPTATVPSATHTSTATHMPTATHTPTATVTPRTGDTTATPTATRPGGAGTPEPTPIGGWKVFAPAIQR